MDKHNTTRFTFLLILFLLGLFIAIDLIIGKIIIGDTSRTFRSQHFYYHHGLLPNRKVIAKWHNLTYPFFTNSLGFRDSYNRKIPLTTSKKRILFMGDSHTEGVGIRFPETFTGRLTELVDSSETEILNAAVVSYSPRIHYLKAKYLLEEIGLQFDELYVFIDISDLQNEIVYEDYQPQTPGWIGKQLLKIKNLALNHSFTAHTINVIKRNNQTARFLAKTEEFDEYSKEEAHIDALDLYASFFDGFSDQVLLANPGFHGVSGWLYDDDFIELAKKGLELGKENISRLHDLCKKHEIKLHLSVHPWPEQINMGIKEDLYVNFWKTYAEKNNIEFINLYPTFINPPVSAAMGMEYFIPGDNHWNKNGHWLVAKELEKYILK